MFYNIFQYKSYNLFNMVSRKGTYQQYSIINIEPRYIKTSEMSSVYFFPSQTNPTNIPVTFFPVFAFTRFGVCAMCFSVSCYQYGFQVISRINENGSPLFSFAFYLCPLSLSFQLFSPPIYSFSTAALYYHLCCCKLL